MNRKVAVLSGDGIGPEIVAEALRVLDRVGQKYGHCFEYDRVDFGGCSLDKHGVPVTDEGIERCKSADAVLLGAVGGPKWDTAAPSLRPEKALLRLRKDLGLFANLRPARLFPQLKGASPLKGEAAGGVDLMIVRELTGGIYFGEKKTETKAGVRTASDTMTYGEDEIERIGKVAFECAAKRRGRLASVDKANILASSQLWRAVMHGLAERYPQVEYCDILVDNAAMQLVRRPSQFDVLVTSNMFGDILSDEAAALTGSIGMMPSASLSSGTLGVYEAIHGSAPDIAGKDVANPLGTVLSAAMMLRYSFGMEREADDVERAVDAVLGRGVRTRDICGVGQEPVSCSGMGKAVCAEL